MSPRSSPHEVLKDASVVNVQSYVGLSSPYNFNGLVRHYFLRRGPHLADLQVNLAAEGRAQRAEPRHRQARREIGSCRSRDGSTPRSRYRKCRPGPPVLQTLVAEIYGPDPSRRLELAGQVKSVLEQTPGVVDVDWYVAAPQAKTSLVVDETRASAAARHGGARVGCRPDGDRRPHRRPPARCACARGCPDCPAVAALGPGIAGRSARAAPGPEPRRRRRADARRDAHGSGQPVPQEPAARDLRDRRSRRRRRKPGLRDPAHERASSRT